MKNKIKVKEPPIPVERFDTIRHKIVSLLSEHSSSVKQISHQLRLPEKDVCDHLEHIRRTMHKGSLQLKVEPASCHRCGFVFRKRDKLRKPGKCPLCRSELIAEPLFAVVRAGRSKDAPNAKADPVESLERYFH